MSGTGSSLRISGLVFPLRVANGDEAGLDVNSPDWVSGILLGIEDGPSRLEVLFLGFGFISGVGVLEP